VDARRWLATAAHALAGVVGILGVLIGLILLRAAPGWGSLGVVVALGVLAIGLEAVANRLGPATVPSSHRARAIGAGVGFGAIPFLLGLLLLAGQADTTAQHLAGEGVARPGTSCCRGDLAFPLGGMFTAWGLWTGLALALPVHLTDTTIGPSAPRRLLWPLVGAGVALPVTVLVQVADLQASSVTVVALSQALPTAATVTLVSLLGFGSRLTVAVGGVTKVVGPVRRHVPLRRDTFVAIVGANVVLRHGGKGFRIHLQRWGAGAILPHRLHRALHLSDVPGSYNELRQATPAG
jgi:hypothetical protein